MSNHIVSVGDLVVDLIFPVTLPMTSGHHQDIKGMRIEPGGACNVMLAAQRIGATVSAIGAVGGDAFGLDLLNTLAEEGIDVSGVERPDNSKTTLVLVLTDTDKHEHVFVGAYGMGRDAVYNAEVKTIVESADAILVQGYTLYEPRVGAMAVDVMQHARSLAIPVYLDVGPTLHQVTPEKIGWAVKNTDVVLMTEDEIGGVSGGRSGNDAYQYLLHQGVNTIVIKQGERGCTIVQNGFHQHFPGFRVPVVDTVGAGDCFDAAFISAVLKGHDLQSAATMANAMGAASVQKVGAGKAVPNRAEVNAILAGTGLAF